MSRAGTGPSLRATLAAVLHHAPWTGLVILGLASFFSLPWSLDLPIDIVVASGCALTLLTVWIWRGLPQQMVWRAPSARWIWCVVAAGFGLRLAFILLVPPVQLSDMNEYLELARRLLAGDGYRAVLQGHEVFAWRPVGYPLLLAAAMALIGDHWWMPAALNLLFYGASAWVLADLATRLLGRSAALLAVCLFAFWPSGIMMTGLAATELVSLLLLLLVAWGTVRASEESSAVWWIVTGLALGSGTLIRPSLMLMPLLLLFLAVLAPAGVHRHLRHAALSFLVAALCVGPWTYRNYLHFGVPVVVSTNGGDVLYRSNNPIATGGFAAAGAQDFSSLLGNEVEWDRAAKAAAVLWIRENPVAFARLAVRKIAISAAEDSTGAYWAIHRAHGVDGALYRAAVGVSNLWWIGVWLLALVALLRQRGALTQSSDLALIMWMAILLPAVHSVFEAQPRYHMPMIGLLVFLAAMVVAPVKMSSRVPSALSPEPEGAGGR